VTKGAGFNTKLLPKNTDLFFAIIFAQDKAFEFSGRREHGSEE